MDIEILRRLYEGKGMSASEIARQLGCSEHKVNYWMKRYSIRKRSISEALSVKKHGVGGGFSIKKNMSLDDWKLYGLGLGIYWGEGNKKNKHTVRVGNTDPKLIAVFVEFLVKICGVTPLSIRYGLQLFSDMSEANAIDFWLNELKIDKSQIMPTINRIISGKIGTYKTKNRYGVMTVYVFNMKLRNWMINELSVPR